MNQGGRVAVIDGCVPADRWSDGGLSVLLLVGEACTCKVFFNGIFTFFLGLCGSHVVNGLQSLWQGFPRVALELPLRKRGECLGRRDFSECGMGDLAFCLFQLRTAVALMFSSYCLLPLFFLSFFHLTYSRRTSSLPSCLWSLRIFPSLPGSRLTIFYRDSSSALLQLVNQWLNFTYSRSHAFRYERKNTNPTLVRIELTTFALAGVQITCYCCHQTRACISLKATAFDRAMACATR